MSDFDDESVECRNSDDDDDSSIDSADIFVAERRTPETKAPPIYTTVTSATTTRIIIPFLRKEILSQLDHRRKKGPDVSQDILDKIGSASISLFNSRARRSFRPVAPRMLKRPISNLSSMDGTPSPSKRMRHPRTCSNSPTLARSKTDFTSPQTEGPAISYDFFDCDLRRCHVEDLFELPPSTAVLLLVPMDSLDYNYFKELAETQRDREKVNINGTQFIQLDAVVSSNTKRDIIMPMMKPNYSSTLIYFDFTNYSTW
jgi:hypothetical protein